MRTYTLTNPLPVVISFFGEQQAGKSTYANYISTSIEDLLDYSVLHGSTYNTWETTKTANTFSFATPLKERTQLLLPHLDVYNVDKNSPRPELGGRSLREEWQTDGERIRDLGTDESGFHLLTSVLKHKITYNTDNILLACVDDMRHNDEYEMLKGFPKLFVKMTTEDSTEQYGADRVSEIDWPNFEADTLVLNDKSKDSLGPNCRLIVDKATRIWLKHQRNLDQKT